MRLIIFDFDGVVADSEALANQTLAEGLSGIGLPTTTQEALLFYMGRRWTDCAADMERRLGRALPDGFLSAQITAIHARIFAEVSPVPGVLDFLQQHADVARCIASSSSINYLRRCLDCMGMTSWFEHLFSGQDVQHGKPRPDLFLKAAAALGATPAECVVIEDSPMGVMAGRAAQMFTIGLCAGRHVLDGHAGRLAEAGADVVVSSYAEVDQVLTAHGF